MAGLEQVQEQAADFLATQVTALSALVAWLGARGQAITKSWGFKLSKSLAFYALFLVPGPWVLLWAWGQPEYNASKKMVMKLPVSLGGDALPSFISNPLELALTFQTALVGVFAVVELLGLLLGLCFCRGSSSSSSSKASAAGEEAEGAAPAAAAPARAYSLQGLLYLCAAQFAGLFVLFCTDAPLKEFTGKYSILPGVNVRAPLLACPCCPLLHLLLLPPPCSLLLFLPCRCSSPLPSRYPHPLNHCLPSLYTPPLLRAPLVSPH
jgi:hypothetical protein